MKKKLILMLIMLFLGISKVYALEIPVNSYIIGEYLFTRDGSDEYNGVLETKYIMMASKSISSKDFEDMVIYFKIGEDEFGDGIYIDGATGEKVDANFSISDIKYYDMKRIPDVRKYVTTATNNDPTKKSYSVCIDTDEDKSLLGYDYYGVARNFGTLDPEVFGKENVTYCFEEDGDCPELLPTHDSCYTFSLDADSTDVYTVMAYPFINIKTMSGENKKVYLPADNNSMTVKNDLVLNLSKENGVIKANITDKNGKKYNGSVYLYVDNSDETKEEFDMFDLVTLLEKVISEGTENASLYRQLYNKHSDAFKKVYDLVMKSYKMPNKSLVGFTSGTSSDDNIIDVYDMSLNNNPDLAYSGYALVMDEVDDNYNQYYVPYYNYTPSTGVATPLPPVMNDDISDGVNLLSYIILVASLADLFD